MVRHHNGCPLCVININIWILLSNYLPSPHLQKRNSCYLLVLVQMILVQMMHVSHQDYILSPLLLFSASWIWQLGTWLLLLFHLC